MLTSTRSTCLRLKEAVMETMATVRTTSERWWQGIKQDPEAVKAWLMDQYHGEATAAERIIRFRDQYAVPGTREHRILTVIAGQEQSHGEWVGELLRVRGGEPVVLVKQERYWEKTLSGISDFSSGAAVAAHAEEMRLARIKVIVDDPEAPSDVRDVFRRILPQERFHARAFAQMAGSTALEAALARHEQGLEALSLIPAAAV